MFRHFRPAADLSPRNSTPKSWSLDHTLLRLGRHDVWTTRDACACTLIFGDTGSGKTSGSGQAVARSMLKAGFGGLVLTAKEGETRRWIGYLRDAGRENDLVLFSPEGPHRFNFLEYERTRAPRGGGSTENLVALFTTILSAGDQGGGQQDPFWERALKQLLRNIIDALRLAGTPLTINRMHDIITSAPIDAAQLEEGAWRDRSYLFKTLADADRRCTDDRDRNDLAATAEYWLHEFATTMDERTRGNIISTFTTMADGFKRGDLRELFSTTTTITPEGTFGGRVIVLDLPTKQFHELGAQAQVIWKACWQRAVESADRRGRCRPVFLWVDEAQFFVTPKEAEFVQTVREQRACCVYISQAIANYYNAFGPGAQAAVDAFLGIAKTKILHCNADPQTNEWAQRMISEDWRLHASEGHSEKGGGGADAQRSTNWSRHRAPRILASEFGKLRCGGPPDYLVQAILFESGRRFRGGDGNVIRIAFDQRLKAGK